MADNGWKPETDAELAARLVTTRDERIKGLSALLGEKEAENARIKSAIEWQKKTIAARDARIDALEGALRWLLDGVDSVIEGSILEEEATNARAVLQAKDAPKEGEDGDRSRRRVD